MTYITEKELKDYDKEANLETIHLFAERIADNIKHTWGYKECEDYMNNLINDSRDGTRQGFPKDVACAIMQLLRQHGEEYK